MREETGAEPGRESSVGRQRMLRDERVLDDSAADEVFLDDPLEHRRVALPVPGAFGIDDRDRAAFADAQAIGLAAKDPALLRQAELLEARLQIVPGGESALLVAALRLRLI